MTATQAITVYWEPLIWPKTDPPPEPRKTILQHLHDHDRTAVKDCLNTYGDKVWTLAKRFTRSLQEAELVSEAIFHDIWIYSATEHEDADPDEERVITQIAIRRLLTNQWAGRKIF